MSCSQDFQYSPVIFNIFLLRDEDENLELVSSGIWAARFYGQFSILHDEKIFTKFEEGLYLIQVSAFWKVEVDDQIMNLSYYSDQNLDLKEIDASEGNDMFYEFLLRKCQDNLRSSTNDYDFAQQKFDRLNMIYYMNKNSNYKFK